MRRWTFAALCALFATAAHAQNNIETVQVTATRLPESVGDVPADVSIITGEELRERQAHDLSTALALTAGVEAPAGGDAGPSSAVPSFWGLHEFDAFLLVVDGVPWGGAFNPAIPALDFNDVQRIEVLKGSAPVAFGATSFVGVIHMLHYPAGQAANQLDLAYGNYDSWRAAGSIALPNWGDWRHSFAADWEQRGFADDRESLDEGHLLYRAETQLGPGTFRLDADISLVHDVPPSPTVREGARLTDLTPINANYNPANAKMDENRYHVSLGYLLPTAWGEWSTLVSYAHSDIRDVRGFLRDDLTDSGDPNADSADKHRTIQDVYVDTHLTRTLAENAELVIGADLMYGLGRQSSANGEYFVPLSGRVIPPPTTLIHVDETNTIRDKRVFGGQYAEFDWRPMPDLDILAGLRLNETFEDKNSGHLDGFDPADNEFAHEERSTTRLSGVIGASYRAWKEGADEAVIYADYRNAFKPAAIDFGFEFEPDVLEPETADSYEVGIKGALAGGRFTYNAEAFLLNFSNLVVATTNENGAPELRNAGGERLKGFELETRYLLAPDLSLAANISWHDARFTNFVLSEGGNDPVDVSGNQLTLAPHILASAGLLYTPPQGFHGSAVVNFVGRRFLDEENEAPTSSYATLDITAGYRFGRYDMAFAGSNLTNERPPVTQSEFGSSSFYLLPARTYWLQLSAAL
ncbi:MAG: TonB-dependent receptor [Alphaproteobacteria bacterium]|nr:TonB-dependent receptor [Alphaproteobacteria bacterium]